MARKKKVPVRQRPPLPPPDTQGFIDQANRANTILELHLLYRNARDMRLLTSELEDTLRDRAAHLRSFPTRL